MIRKSIAVLALSSLVLSGCCTIRQKQAVLNVESCQPGTSINIDGYDMGETPQSFYLDPRRSHDVTLSKEGYESQSFELTSELSISKLGSNLLFPITGGMAGLAVGAATQACDIGLMMVTYAGLGIGVGVACVSAIIDASTGHANDLSHDTIDACLVRAPLQ